MIGIQQMWFARNATTSTDPYYSNVSLLLHMDGTNGSTTFTDNSPTPKTVTANANAAVNTSIVKFGTGSYAGDGNGDYLFVSGLTGGLSSGDFTIEFWVYFNTFANPSSGSFVFGASPNYIGIGVTPLGAMYSQNYNNGSNTPLYTNSSLSLNTWYYYAVVRSAGLLNTYLNGIKQTVTPDASAPWGTQYASITQAYIGNYTFNSPTVSLNGYLDDFRITPGVARYTSNFTPPTAPFPNS